MLTLQAKMFGLVAAGYSSLLPLIIAKPANALGGVTPRHTAITPGSGVYDRLTLWKAAGRRTHEFRAACSLFATDFAPNH
jgi:hypothetical protein